MCNIEPLNAVFMYFRDTFTLSVSLNPSMFIKIRLNYVPHKFKSFWTDKGKSIR